MPALQTTIDEFFSLADQCERLDRLRATALGQRIEREEFDLLGHLGHLLETRLIRAGKAAINELSHA